ADGPAPERARTVTTGPPRSGRGPADDRPTTGRGPADDRTTTGRTPHRRPCRHSLKILVCLGWGERSTRTAHAGSRTAGEPAHGRPQAHRVLADRHGRGAHPRGRPD